MKILVGLGNPGQKYTNNRHNVGHMFIDYLKTQQVQFKLLKTDCFMNQSGTFIKNLNIKTEDLFIAHDDLDIPLGKFKIQFASGPKVHNGLSSIEGELGTNEFWRIRIGVDNRDPQNRIDGETYVLQDFTEDEEKVLSDLFPVILERLVKLQSKNNKI